MNIAEKPHYIGHRMRLKEKFKGNGFEGWLDHEVLEFLLMFSIPRKDTKPVAKMLLQHYKTFAGVLEADVSELSGFQGITEHSALFLKSLRDVCGFYLKNEIAGKDILSSPQAAVHYLKSVLKGAKDEEFHVLYLDAGNHFITSENMQTGTVNKSAVYPRKIVERALHNRALGVIIAHNHPSGALRPSEDDRKATKDIAAALETVDIALLDHIIIAGNGYFSWKEHGLL